MDKSLSDISLECFLNESNIWRDTNHEPYDVMGQMETIMRGCGEEMVGAKNSFLNDLSNGSSSDEQKQMAERCTALVEEFRDLYAKYFVLGRNA